MMANAVANARATNQDALEDGKTFMTQEQVAAQLSSMNREKMEKLRVKKNTEFEHNLTNMLIHLYNGKNCNDFIKEYKVILDNVIPLFAKLLANMDQAQLRPLFPTAPRQVQEEDRRDRRPGQGEAQERFGRRRPHQGRAQAAAGAGFKCRRQGGAELLCVAVR